MKTKINPGMIRGKSHRKHKVTTVNFEAFHLEILKRKKINVSILVRQLLDEFLKENFPALYDEWKNDPDNQ
jgi:hypothetical protein